MFSTQCGVEFREFTKKKKSITRFDNLNNQNPWQKTRSHHQDQNFSLFTKRFTCESKTCEIESSNKNKHFARPPWKKFPDILKNSTLIHGEILESIRRWLYILNEIYEIGGYRNQQKASEIFCSPRFEPNIKQDVSSWAVFFRQPCWDFCFRMRGLSGFWAVLSWFSKYFVQFLVWFLGEVMNLDDCFKGARILWVGYWFIICYYRKIEQKFNRFIVCALQRVHRHKNFSKNQKPLKLWALLEFLAKFRAILARFWAVLNGFEQFARFLWSVESWAIFEQFEWFISNWWSFLVLGNFMKFWNNFNLVTMKWR